ncbi:gamma-glutamyltransferase family protein [Actimicrobium sp. CCC2.4]|uniref:gamma-glutamyltransferase family protein n=1 Tax=Actimicrobium sp. CCC2.4 TaxID=3048606 RepID=UPI002AC8ABE0|nr:gamma-glutamyltransferase family protein [Actimicrobium sp. CCC2.4]MEB0135199.1 gamma-glutamyltransferase family protein [Actimicrobium sp. CCC2.4]WPX30995.1 gamma-glutamyltransferase family protein [Actimicrobium sp. CCC2.4]
MLNTARATHAIAVAPHHLAAQSALAVMRDGGNAIEAMVAAAATIAVVYPHMNGIGGDSFWVIVPPVGEPIAIDACGQAALAATIEAYRSRGLAAIPIRGPLAANTVAGTIGGWNAALEVAAELGGTMPLARLLRDAIGYAQDGVPVTLSQQNATASKLPELATQPGFADTFLIDGVLPLAGQRFVQARMARTLGMLVRDGLDSFYRGALATEIAADLETVGTLLGAADLAACRAQRKTPLRLAHSAGTVYNMTPPTQGAVSLAILGLLDRAGLAQVDADSADHVHLVVEATKRAFGLRDQFITDPADMTVDPQSLLAPERLDALAATISLDKAAPWGNGKGPGDTIWMGTIDESGLAVSFIQSIYHEFGSGVVLPNTGINWQNRGASFSLDGDKLLALKPGKKPFHTLNPAAARLNDGRTMVYGTMGGDGQPQTQAAVFTRHVVFGQPLQTAVTAPRWLLGRTWGQSTDTLKLEQRFPQAVIDALAARGHDVEVLLPFDETMGHAGALVRHPDGMLEGASDPRSDGGVAGY